MLVERLRELLKSLDPDEAKVLQRVWTVEQENINRQRPQLGDEIDKIITEIATAAMKRDQHEGDGDN